ncbi:unnamed protein product [Clonostachys byssicola]|uniref:Uncharacterized protein n=1 Tax=Clonostachys byssicola TaxID=160290 RepID=A0A9N9UP57_9HYPO|nr:unnamed protein product [Clonostachys byssicola]
MNTIKNCSLKRLRASCLKQVKSNGSIDANGPVVARVSRAIGSNFRNTRRRSVDSTETFIILPYPVDTKKQESVAEEKVSESAKVGSTDSDEASVIQFGR